MTGGPILKNVVLCVRACVCVCLCVCVCVCVRACVCMVPLLCGAPHPSHSLCCGEPRVDDYLFFALGCRVGLDGLNWPLDIHCSFQFGCSVWFYLLVKGNQVSCIRQWCEYKCVCVCVCLCVCVCVCVCVCPTWLDCLQFLAGLVMVL